MKLQQKPLTSVFIFIGNMVRGYLKAYIKRFFVMNGIKLEFISRDKEVFL